MKRYFVLLLLLIPLLLFSGVSVYAIRDIAVQEDQVTLTEEASQGDVSAADGLTVRVKTSYPHHLFWDTAYTFSQDPTVSTVHQFYTVPYRGKNEVNYYGLGIRTHLTFGLDLTTKPEELTGLNKAYRELYDSLTPGESGTKTVYLKDYYTYYPLAVHTSLPPVLLMNGRNLPTSTIHGNVNGFLCDYFRIPVRSGDKVTITVEKDANTTGMSSMTVPAMDSGNGEFYFNASLYRDCQCYFAFNAPRGYDLSAIPEGAGYYCLPITGEGHDFRFDTQHFVNIYPIRQGDAIYSARFSGDGRQILLYTCERNCHYFVVLDVASKQLVQRLPLQEKTLANSYSNTYDGEDFYVFSYEGGPFLVVTPVPDGSGTYRIDLTIPEVENPYYQKEWTAMAYRPGQLAIVEPYEHPHSLSPAVYPVTDCGFSLSLYGESGLIYSGQYHSSLTCPWDAYDYNGRVRPSYFEPPFSLSFQ